MSATSSIRSPADLPYATSDVPGIGGTIKTRPEDFIVEEIPAYPPCGSGEHLFLLIEKRGRTTLDAAARIARACGVPRGAVGYAGMKDARAVTRQWFSVHLPKGGDAPALDGDDLRVLAVSRHRNKLKLGHLKGNRFQVRLRDVAAGAGALAARVIAILESRGMPNGFGVQRFGTRGDTHRLGRALLAGDSERFVELAWSGVEGGERALELLRRGETRRALESLPPGSGAARLVAALERAGATIADAPRFVERPLRRLYFAAVQAECFNEVLRRRFADYDSVRAGDLAWLHRNGACFSVVDLDVERERARRLEISASGPLFGPRCSRPTLEPLAIEEEVLADLGLTSAAFSKCAEMDGARRPLRVPVSARVTGEDVAGRSLDVAIELPPGAYATGFLAELTKRSEPEVDAGEE